MQNTRRRSRSVPHPSREPANSVRRSRPRSLTPPRRSWIPPVPVGTKRRWDEVFDEGDNEELVMPLEEQLEQLKCPSTSASWDGPSSPPGEVMVGGAAPPLLDFVLRPVGARRNWRNVLNRQSYQGRIQQHRDPQPHDDLGQELTNGLRRTIQQQIEADHTLTPHSTLHFVMQSDAFTHAFQSTTFTVGEFEEGSDRLDTYLQALAQKLNSNQEFTPDDSFTIEITFIRTPGPGSGNGKRYRPSKAAVRGIVKRSRVTIKNRDELCCARAIVTMKALVDANGDARDRDYHNLKQGYPVQEIKAKELHRLAGVPEGPCGISELQQFQAALSGYQIKVMSIDPPHMIIYQGLVPSDKIIRLIKEDGHYDGCNSFKGFLSKSYFCDECNRGYNQDDMDHHPCNGKWCSSCRRRDCPDFTEAKRLLDPGNFPTPSSFCPLCHRTFFGENCYTYHLQRRSRNISSICDNYKRCPECCCTYEVKNAGKSGRPKQHKCGWGECPVCKKQVHIASHQCYIQTISDEEDERKEKRVLRDEVGTRPFREPDPDDPDNRVHVEREPPLQVYADYEATTNAEGIQTPILLCAETDEDEETMFFYGPDCTERFFEWLEEQAVDIDGDDREAIVIFHNLKGYDGLFLLEHCYSHHREVENPITVGTKILSFKSDRLTFKDSLCFLSFPLADFPTTFGLTELYKGFFPHLFNTMENQNYKGPLPDKSFYDPDGMSSKKKEEFELWYAGKVVNNYQFDLRRDMLAYCESDVKLLKAGCRKFREQFQEHAEFDPLEKTITIASACMRFWQKKLLTPNTVASEPVRGWYGARSNQSVKAMKWLAWREHLLRSGTCSSATGEPQGDRIRHAGNGGEERVLNFLVDGFDACDPTTGRPTVYEFHGCLWHGCPHCHPHPHRNSISKLHPDRTLQEMYEATILKHQRLREAGYHLVIKWECEWNQDVKTNVELQQFLSTLELVEPLEPRNAFFGGRTNAVRLHHEVDETQEEKIKYIDVTSLYPWVNKNCEYPVGHPHVITNPEDQDIHSYFGVAKVDIHPPFGLYHPVLPFRHRGKLTFPLCCSCMEEEMAKPLLKKSHHCSHSEEERMLRGTWCTPELQKAVELGYQVLKIHEVWHFPRNQRKKGLFADYVNTWLKIKQESAGYPGWVTTEEEKQQYVHNYREKEGIQLDPELIVKNPGRKATAKLMLNSFWGKFGENLNKNITQAVTTPAELFGLVSNTLLDIHAVRVCSDEVMEVVYSHLVENQPDNGKTNIFIAAFTTCCARLKLYSYLEQLQKQVLYFDTDSVIYSHQPGQVDIPLGDYLGEMTDELEGDDYIVDFTSAGPKNYGYRTTNGKECCKVRGFTLNVRGGQQLNYQVMRQNLLEELTDPQDERRHVEVVNPYFFTRDPATKRLKVGPHIKRYGLVFDKRVVDPETFESYPYGYTPILDDVDMVNVETLMTL